MKRAAGTLAFDEDLLKGNWVQVSSKLLRCPLLSTDAKALYCILLTYAGNDIVAFPGQDTLCRELSISEHPLRRAVQDLLQAGLMTCQRGGDGHNTRYHVRKYGNSLADQNKSRDAESADQNKSRDAESADQNFQKRIFSGFRPAECAPELDTEELDIAAAASLHSEPRKNIPRGIEATEADAAPLTLAYFEGLEWFKGYSVFCQQFPNDAAEFAQQIAAKATTDQPIRSPECYFRPRIIDTLRGDRDPAAALPIRQPKPADTSPYREIKRGGNRS